LYLFISPPLPVKSIVVGIAVSDNFISPPLFQSTPIVAGDAVTSHNWDLFSIASWLGFSTHLHRRSAALTSILILFRRPSRLTFIIAGDVVLNRWTTISLSSLSARSVDLNRRLTVFISIPVLFRRPSQSTSSSLSSSVVIGG